MAGALMEEHVIRFATLVAFGLFVGACNSDGGDTGDDDDTDGGGPTHTEEIIALTPDTANGATIFGGNCSSCHDTDGAGITGLGSDIRGHAQAETIKAVLDAYLEPPPEPLMVIPPYTDQEIADVSAFVETEL